KTAVYDVRDLCRDSRESKALHEAIENQAHPETWENIGGLGSISFPRPGVLVVFQTEQVHDAVLQLLENYRLALRASKPRVPKSSPQEIVTRYYRMPTPMANDF